MLDANDGPAIGRAIDAFARGSKIAINAIFWWQSFRAGRMSISRPKYRIRECI
jgi:hypothetical protein